jgi:hypothetical protein
MDKQLHLKEKIKEQYGKIALDGNSNSCCVPSSDCGGTSSEVLISPFESSNAIGYDVGKLNLIPKSSVLGVGCGNSTRFADINKGNTVVDRFGSWHRCISCSQYCKGNWKIIGIDMTENMLKKARENAQKHG